jgi:hypothetical protein
MLWLLYDGAHFQVCSPGHTIPTLQANQAYYVSNSGSDTYDGVTSAYSSGSHGPWATLQHAMNFISQFNLNGYSITINVANGTYPRVALGNMAGSGTVNWVGNPSSPASVVINGAGLSAIMAQRCGTAHSFNGFQLQTSGTVTNEGMNGADIAGTGTALSMLNMTFYNCSGSHIAITQDGVCGLGGNITISGSCSGNSLALGCHLYAANGALYQPNSNNPPTLTITNPVSFAGPFVECSSLSFVQAMWVSITGASYVSAMKYNVNYNANLTTGGGGPNYIPGSVAGTQAAGGQYS